MGKKKSKTVDIVCVVDRSGSMQPLTDDTIGGFNTFLKEQKELPGEANLTLVLFNHEYGLICDRVPVQDVKNLNRKTYFASGMTALLDAIGKAVTNVRDSQEKKTPTIVAIFTDGYENASKEYKLETVKVLIEKLQEKNWEFHFLGAGIDAIGEAVQLGIDSQNVVAAAADSRGIAQTYSAYTVSAKAFRTKNQ